MYIMTKFMSFMYILCLNFQSGFRLSGRGGKDVLEMDFYAAVHLGFEATGRGVVDAAYATDFILERVNAVGLGVNLVETACGAEPVEHSVSTSVGEGHVAFEAHLLGIGSRIVVLARSEAFDEDGGDYAIFDNVADFSNCRRIGIVGDMAFVGGDCGIDVGEADEIFATVDGEVVADGLETAVGVEPEALGLIVVVVVEETLR